MANILRDAGWSTFWVGKNHNIPIDEWTMGASKKNWPLGQGYDRFYGFIGGETNNWYPSLAEDNHYIDQPYLPEDGYHLSKDLADQALPMIRDSKQTEPDKPWYLWFCPGATHAPHHAPQEYIDKYKGAWGLCIGYDSADPVSSMYTSGFRFTGGTIKKVVFDIADDAYVDVEAHLAAAMARD